MTICKFEKGELIEKDFYYAYSPHSKNVRVFEQRENYVANYIENSPEEYSYTSIITKKRYGTGAKAFTECSFGKFGAPLIVFTDDMSDGKDGMKLYGLHFEVVAYEGGVNVWHIVPDPENEKRPIKSTLIAKKEFEILPDEMIDISVSFEENGVLSINVNGNELQVEHEEFPQSFHVGITGCEGPDKFYIFSVEE